MFLYNTTILQNSTEILPFNQTTSLFYIKYPCNLCSQKNKCQFTRLNGAMTVF